MESPATLGRTQREVVTRMFVHIPGCRNPEQDSSAGTSARAASMDWADQVPVGLAPCNPIRVAKADPAVVNNCSRCSVGHRRPTHHIGMADRSCLGLVWRCSGRSSRLPTLA